ncbi:SgcJ/EcaC family oxidoreductase [Dactylosporangium siamense]|uniref:DUF4440 domain-containing protein n=1 Tax=Dactylosporangium siamense TaxID=685454 RepID=A0A919UCT9_9ACTN|nr:SgcJ/EcaC family oxidoreductase [Dactylosporangium siamense]GIG47171.1 hypothetical protein Dsi01nite_052120 [Dactylosporangium siamense]
MTTEVTTSQTDQAAVAAVPQRVVTAWAAQDADAFADVFTADGTMILPGQYLKGRDDINAFMSKAFAGPYLGTRVTGEPLDLRVRDNLAVIVTYGGVLASGDTEVSDAQAIRATWVVVKEDDGQWRLAAYQNSPAN